MTLFKRYLISIIIIVNFSCLFSQTQGEKYELAFYFNGKRIEKLSYNEVCKLDTLNFNYFLVNSKNHQEQYIVNGFLPERTLSNYSEEQTYQRVYNKLDFIFYLRRIALLASCSRDEAIVYGREIYFLNSKNKEVFTNNCQGILIINLEPY